jgi:hypothetical protein
MWKGRDQQRRAPPSASRSQSFCGGPRTTGDPALPSPPSASRSRCGPLLPPPSSEVVRAASSSLLIRRCGRRASPGRLGGTAGEPPRGKLPTAGQSRPRPEWCSPGLPEVLCFASPCTSPAARCAPPRHLRAALTSSPGYHAAPPAQPGARLCSPTLWSPARSLAPP